MRPFGYDIQYRRKFGYEIKYRRLKYMTVGDMTTPVNNDN